MATILTRCLFFLLLFCHLKIPHTVVDTPLLDVEPFPRPEQTGLLDWESNVLEGVIGVENIDAGPLPSLPTQTLELHQMSEDVGLNADFGSDEERPSAGGSLSLFYGALLMVQKCLGTFSDMIIGCLPKSWQPGPTPLRVPLEAVVLTTAIEILLLLVFARRRVHLKLEDERTRHARRLLSNRKRICKLQERVAALERDGADLERQKLELQTQAEAAEQRLQVVDQLCWEKDLALQQKLIQEQEVDTVLHTYKLQIQEIQQEKQRSEHNYRGQIDYHQRRAYASLMKACALERALEQERSETERLHQLLVISVNLTKFQLSTDTTAGSDCFSLMSGADDSMAYSQPSSMGSLLPDLAMPLRPRPRVNASLIGQTQALATPANRSLPAYLGLHT